MSTRDEFVEEMKREVLALRRSEDAFADAAPAEYREQRDNARARLAAASARVADLEAGIRALADEWDQDDHLTYYCDRFVNDLRALVGDETPEASDG